MMKNLTALVIPFLALAALPTAHAQPGTAEQPPVRSSEPPRGRLSQINNVPIKVGTHNEYYYDIKKWNVSSNPIGWMLGLYGLSVSYAASSHVALRGDVNYYAEPNDSRRGYEIGIGAPIYFRRTYQGVFLEPGLIVRQSWSDYGDGTYQYVSTTVGPQVLVGWHWLWDSGLNVAVALGAGRNMSTCDDSCYDEEEPFVNGYARFGYAF